MKRKATTLTTNSFKGGCGKSTSLITLAAYLYRYLHKHLLLIDTDPQGNFSSMFDLSKEQIKKYSIMNAYKHDAGNPKKPWNLKPLKINDYISINTATSDLSEASDVMRHKNTLAPFVIYHYLKTNKEFEKYDYILIDTHNSFNLNTQDALLCSDYIMMPITASRFSMDGIKKTQRRINDLKDNLINPSGDSLITANTFMIGSIVSYNTKAGHEFINAMKHDKHFVTYYHRRELFNRANFHHNDVFKEAKNGTADQKVVENEIKPHTQKIVDYMKKTTRIRRTNL